MCTIHHPQILSLRIDALPLIQIRQNIRISHDFSSRNYRLNTRTGIRFRECRLSCCVMQGASDMYFWAPPSRSNSLSSVAAITVQNQNNVQRVRTIDCLFTFTDRKLEKYVLV